MFMVLRIFAVWSRAMVYGSWFLVTARIMVMAAVIVVKFMVMVVLSSRRLSRRSSKRWAAWCQCGGTSGTFKALHAAVVLTGSALRVRGQQYNCEDCHCNSLTDASRPMYFVVHAAPQSTRTAKLGVWISGTAALAFCACCVLGKLDNCTYFLDT